MRASSSSLRFCSAGKNPGHDGVDADPMGRQLAGEIAGQDVDPRLRDRIGEDARQRDLRGGGREVDDRPALATVDHRPTEDLAGDQGRRQVRVEDAMPLLQVQLEERSRAVDSHRVDEDVDRTEEPLHIHAGLLDGDLGPRHPGPAAAARVPSASSAATSSSARSRERSITATVAPARPKPWHTAPPRTPAPPMTAATLPVRSKRAVPALPELPELPELSPAIVMTPGPRRGPGRDRGPSGARRRP